MTGPEEPGSSQATGPQSAAGLPRDPGPHARLAVAVISAGRVGATLGAALAAAGHVPVAACGVSQASQQRVESLLGDVPMLPADEACARADLVLLSVPDDVLPGLVRGLAAAGAFRRGHIVAHTAGSLGLSVLEPATQAGALGIALHPAMTFTGRAEDLQRLPAAAMAVTAADEVGESVGTALATEIGMEPVTVPDAARGIYHTALTHAANHMVTLVNDGMALLRTGGIAHPDRVLAPLLSAALDNALRLGDQALTGPVVRGDTRTVARHLAVLEENAPEQRPYYRAGACRTLQRAMAAQLLSAAAGSELRAALREPHDQEEDS